MRLIKLLFALLYCCCGVYCAPSLEPTTEKELKDSSEVSIPVNMNIADYYYSLFGKHLDYDYREPLITFGETENNDLEEIESEVDRNTDDVLWNSSPSHGNNHREKRFIIPVPVNSNVYNSTRRWFQNAQRLRMERRRLRMQRRRQWRQNRINYLNQRSETLRRQAELLTTRQMQQFQERLQTTRTRSVPTQKPQDNTFRITLPVTSTSKPGTTASSSSTTSTAANTNLIASSSNQIPVKQVPIPV